VEESERLVVPMKPGNRPRDPGEGRGRGVNEPSEGTMPGTSKLENISTRQRRIAELARQMPDKALYSLAKHIDLEWLKEAYRQTRKDGAVGVDGQTSEAFAADLEGNLQRLLDAAKSGLYRAPPVRRALIPKGDGTTRPLGIPTFEDKVLQRAVVMALEPLYETEFYEFSYGFRPGKSAHDALEALGNALHRMQGGWVLDVDIKSFFDTLDHALLRDLLSRRVTDGVIVRLVGKWLNAGVLDGSVVTRAAVGTPQGGVISPLLANIYLHEVLDRWWVEEVKPRLRGEAFLVRYADDFVMVFAREDDARRVQTVLPKRFGRYGLTLHPEKTRLVAYRRPTAHRGPDEPPPPPPGTFDFLGFSHHWAKSRKGYWIPKRKTAKKRFSRALRAVAEWCRANRHRPLAYQQKQLNAKLLGHDRYYGLTGNYDALDRFHYEVRRIWRKWLCRRSQRGYVRWDAFNRLLSRFPLVAPKAYHSVLTGHANL
jgi:RNA-directed DNA polymerase